MSVSGLALRSLPLSIALLSACTAFTGTSTTFIPAAEETTDATQPANSGAKQTSSQTTANDDASKPKPVPTSDPKPVPTSDPKPEPTPAFSVVLRAIDHPGTRVASLAVRGDALFLTGDNPNDGTGFFGQCNLAQCAATLAAVPRANVRFPARVQVSGDDLYVWGTRQTVGPADVVRITANGTATALGSLFTPLGDVAISSLNALGNALLADTRGPQNLGDFRNVSFLSLGPGTPVVASFRGTETDGYRGFRTATRLFVHTTSKSGGALQAVDPTTGVATGYVSGQVAFPFAFGERIGAIEWSARGPGTTPLRQVLCESDTTCAAPVRSELPFVVEMTALAGVFGDKLVYFEAASGAMSGTLRACDKASMLVGACAPTTLANGLPLPARWDSKTFQAAYDGHALYYVDALDRVLRVAM